MNDSVRYMYIILMDTYTIICEINFIDCEVLLTFTNIFRCVINRESTIGIGGI